MNRLAVVLLAVSLGLATPLFAADKDAKAVPAHSFSAPMRAKLTAADRFMPGVCAVLTSSWFDATTRTPWCRHLVSAVMILSRPPGGCLRPPAGSAECFVGGFRAVRGPLPRA